MSLEDHDKFLRRIAKTLYYGKTSSFDTVSLPLTELATDLYNEVKKDSGLDRLQVREVAEFSQNACVSTCSLVLAILYLEKMKATNPEFIEKVAPSELFLVSLLIASKFLNDDSDEEMVLNSEWAVCAGLPLKQVNQIEKKFLEAINWEIYVPEKTFWNRLLQMERYLANQEGKRRGWYSYTELNVLLFLRDFAILKELLTCYTLCCVSYMASVLSMVGFGLLTIQMKDVIVDNVSLDLISESFSLSSSAGSTFNVTNSELTLNETSSTGTEDINLCGINFDSESICDNSSSVCYFSNISSERFFFTVKLPVNYVEISRIIQGMKKLDVIGKKS